MNPFEYKRAEQEQMAIDAIMGGKDAKFLAGGTNLIDLMKNGVQTPSRLVDINRVPLANIEIVSGGGLRLGALARNSDTANHPLVRKNYPLLSQAILSGASAQLRNLATNGGNLLQRTRCAYFMDPAFSKCNKRAPGSGCGAREGINRRHAVLGASEQCVAVHPSDMAVALAALGASVRVRGQKGEHTIPFADFHRLPGTSPQLDTNIQPDELILSIDLPQSPYAAHSHYLKIRDRASYDFALVSVAAALEMQNGVIHSARLALGGVAHKPWRSEKAEALLAGKQPNAAAFEAAAAEALSGAQPLKQNAYKVELAKRAIVRAFTLAGGAA
jgi:xanthine dehydrogenase YagS FAD-binding subunit